MSRLQASTPAGQWPPIHEVQSAAWDAMAQRGHQLVTGAWSVYGGEPERRHIWHVLCSKPCATCGAHVTVERRCLAGSTELRVRLPARRCGEAAMSP